MNVAICYNKVYIFCIVFSSIKRYNKLEALENTFFQNYV